MPSTYLTLLDLIVEVDLTFDLLGCWEEHREFIWVGLFYYFVLPNRLVMPV
jgi:hypothetical protein